MSDDLEEAIEEFVELEAELTSATGGAYQEATVSGGSKVAVGNVPDGYPVAIPTDHALRLDVEADDGTVLETYLPWPEAGSEADGVLRLLDALGLDADEFASIYGERVALEAVDGWHRVDVAGTSEDGGDGWDGSGGGGLDVGESDAALFDEAPPSTDTSFESTDDASLAAFLFPVVAVAMGLGWFVAGTSDVALTVAVVPWGLSLFAIPVSLVYSAYVTSDRGGWDPHPGVWGALGLVPLFNTPVGAAYLLEWVARGRPVRERLRTSLGGVVAATLLSALPLMYGLVVSVEALFDGFVGTIVARTWPYAIVLVPLTIYLDARHAEEASDWDPIKPLWVAAALPTAVVFGGWLVGLAYMTKRYLELG